MPDTRVEPWLRGTMTDVEPVRRAVLHALELAEEDVLHWIAGMDAEALELEPLGLPSVGFQIRHIARSIDRLMTYAAGSSLTEAQMVALRSERVPTSDVEVLRAELLSAMHRVKPFALSFSQEQLPQPRSVGRDRLPTTLAGLLIHIAEHTQRHVGQLITTAKVVSALRESASS